MILTYPYTLRYTLIPNWMKCAVVNYFSYGPVLLPNCSWFATWQPQHSQKPTRFWRSSSFWWCAGLSEPSFGDFLAYRLSNMRSFLCEFFFNKLWLVVICMAVSVIFYGCKSIFWLTLSSKSMYNSCQHSTMLWYNKPNFVITHVPRRCICLTPNLVIWELKFWLWFCHAVRRKQRRKSTQCALQHTQGLVHWFQRSYRTKLKVEFPLV